MTMRKLLILMDDEPVGFVMAAEHQAMGLAASLEQSNPQLSCRAASGEDVPAMRKLVGELDRTIVGVSRA